jgi:hypothetical protein
VTAEHAAARPVNGMFHEWLRPPVQAFATCASCGPGPASDAATLVQEVL